LNGVQQRRPYSRTDLLGLLVKINVSPVGKLRTRPQRYPADTVDRVLNALGEKVVTMTQLRSVRRQAQKARAA
jgi:hypothetical protein